MSCATQIDACMTHGATFQQDVELTVGYDGYRDEGYVGRLNILDYEGGTSLLVLTSPISVDDTLSFVATPAQTQALPTYDLFYFVELYDATAGVDRLYQGKMCMNL